MCEPCYYDYRYEAHKPRFKEIQKNSRAKRKASGKKCIKCGEPAGLLQKLMCLSCYNKKYRVENLAKCLEKERRSALNYKDERLAANREYNQRPDVKKARNKKLRELSYFRTSQPWGWAALQEFLGYQSGEAGEF
jgi:ribosomal protein S14